MDQNSNQHSSITKLQEEMSNKIQTMRKFQEQDLEKLEE